MANPVLLVEILSPSTEAYDLGNKFTHYRKIPALQQVLFVNSSQMNVINQTRVSGTEDWLLQEYSRSDQSFAVLDQGELSLSDIYRKITFEE